MKYQAIIGLEIHLRPKTKSKMFCACANGSDDLPPNTNICPICLGHPGTLPVVNRTAVELGAKMALALNCQIPEQSKFDRKSYFYPDLPKNYQISMYDRPVGVGGWLEIEVNGTSRKIGLTRLHLEEDAAKLIHVSDGSLVDFNRAGAPLMEIVTEPDIRTSPEAKAFMQELRLLARYLEVSEADMEKGQMRCDANISLRPLEEIDDLKMYPKTEIKNLNSFKAVERALEHEISRQTELWEQGAPPKIQSTRGWDDAKQETFEQRTKEEAHDYRYFPEPDIPPLKFGAGVGEFDVAKISASIPETPSAKRARFISEYGFTASDAKILIEDKQVATYTENVLSELFNWLVSIEGSKTKAEKTWSSQKKDFAKLTSGWLSSKLFKLLNASQQSISEIKITPENFAELLGLIYQNKISSSAGQTVLETMFNTGADPSHVIQEKGLVQENDQAKLETMVKTVISQNPGPAADYRSGKQNAIQFLAGLVMKETKGKANPQIVQQLLKDHLK